MDILYKNIYKDEDFKLLTKEDTINLSFSIIKICCKEVIKEVQIDDEIIKNINENKEFIYNKIRTSNKKTIEIKVKVTQEDNREKLYKKIIKINEDSFVHDINEIQMINLLGKKSYDNIINGFNSTENYYDFIMDNLKDEIEDIENILKAITNIIKLSKEINKNPKVDLVEKEIVRDSNEVKKISSQSARYFTMHPEHWYREGESLPKPIKILTETFEENSDIYENQLIVFILHYSKKIIKKIILNLETQISSIYTSITKDKLNINLEEITEHDKSEKEKSIRENEEKINKNKFYLSKFKKLNKEVENILIEFKNIRLNLNLKIKMTQKILYDKRYYRILKYYKKYLSNLNFEVKDLIESNVPTVYNYLFLASEIICKSLCSLGFYEIKTLSNVKYEDVFSNENSIFIQGTHYVDEDNFRFNLEIDGFNNKDPKVLLKISYKENEEKICFKINCDFKNKTLVTDYEDIESLYDTYYEETYDTTIVLNSIALENINFKDEKSKQKNIFKLSTLGNNFINYNDYIKYGGYKMGVIPFSNQYIASVYHKLVKLFRVKFIKLGFINYCTFCNNGQFEYKEEELLVCNSCSKRVAINKCSCGEDIIKFLSKDNVDFVEDVETDIIKYHNDYELKSTNLGSCYEKFYSNSGGFCSKCGKCQKLDGNCIRCKIAQWEE